MCKQTGNEESGSNIKAELCGISFIFHAVALNICAFDCKVDPRTTKIYFGCNQVDKLQIIKMEGNKGDRTKSIGE